MSAKVSCKIAPVRGVTRFKVFFLNNSEVELDYQSGHLCNFSPALFDVRDCLTRAYFRRTCAGCRRPLGREKFPMAPEYLRQFYRRAEAKNPTRYGLTVGDSEDKSDRSTSVRLVRKTL